MRRTIFTVVAVSILMVGGCKKVDDPEVTGTTINDEIMDHAADATDSTNDLTDVAHSKENRFASWQGKWIGPEGMFVEITPLGSEQYKLVMRSDLDTLGTYTGTDSEHGIKFRRNDKDLILRRGSGDETALKYLAGKTECLLVKAGEGFCRD